MEKMQASQFQCSRPLFTKRIPRKVGPTMVLIPIPRQKNPKMLSSLEITKFQLITSLNHFAAQFHL
jgi:hypothetical protein